MNRSLAKKYRLIDLFSGAGGFTLGFTDSRYGGGFQSILALDNDKAALESYAANFGRHGILANIEDWLGTKPKIPLSDVVIGGLPCQGFSLLNKKRQGDSRRSLWQPFMQVVESTQASIFVIENVSEFLRSKECNESKELAERIGFKTACAILNSADYGVPQIRRRGFIIGWKQKASLSPCFPPLPTHSNLPLLSNLPNWLTVRDAIGDLPEPEGTEIRKIPPPLDLHCGRKPTEISLARYQAVPPGGNRFDLQKNAPELTPDCWIKKTSGGTDLFGRLWWDKPSVTIRTEFFKPEKGRYLHPEKHRPITHREAARLMGFPDDFRFIGSKSEIAKQIGNAVPPPLAGAIARTIRVMLDSFEKERDECLLFRS